MTETFVTRYLSINQTIDGPKAYAVEINWYNKFQNYINSLFEDEYQTTMESLKNYSICLCSESSITPGYFKQQLENHFNISANVSMNIQDEQILKKGKEVMKDFVLINEQLWDIVVDTFGAGPCIPLLTLPYEQTNDLRSMNSVQLVTNNDIETLEPNLVVLTENEIIQVILQKTNNDFEVLHLSIPIWFTLQNLYQTLLTHLHDQSIEYLIYDPENGTWINKSCNLYLNEIQLKEFWMLKSNIKNKQKLHLDQNNPVYEFDEQQISHDFHQLNQVNKTRSTGPSTKDSQNFNDLLDLSENENIINEFAQIDIHDNVDEDIPIRDVEEFREQVDMMLKHKKIQLGLLLKPKVIENVNHIIQFLEQELSSCNKMQQLKEEKEERTNDELLDQDI